MNCCKYRLVIAFAAAMWAGCSGGDATVAGQSVAAGADAGAAYPDGWQFHADAAPPTDAWQWNADAGRWRAPADAGSGIDSAGVGPDSGVTDTIAGADGIAPAVDAAAGDAAISDSSAGADSGKMPVVAGGLGAKCSKPADCDAGLYCFAQDTPQAYCGKVGCLSNDECAVATEEPMCCVKYKGQSYCTKQFGATQCGVQDKPPGADCKAGGQSDCKPVNGGFCLQTASEAQCVEGCSAASKNCPAGTQCQVFQNGAGACIPFTPDKSDGTPCAGKTIGGCGAGSWCIEAYPEDPLAYCATLCKDDSACATGFDCTFYSPAQGVCQKHGSTPVGGSCAGDRFSCQKGLFCASAGSAAAVCSPVCSADADCAAFGKSLGQEAYCLKTAGGNFAVCWPKGSKGNGENCSKDPGGCQQGSWCIGGNDAYNPDAYCQKPCGANSDGTCPAGSKCTQYGPNYSGCQPDGGKGQGQSCAGAATSCKAGYLCIGPQGGEVCSQLCKTSAKTGSGDACPVGSWCSGWGNGDAGVCIPSGAIALGKPCKDQAFGCAAGSFCQNWGKGGDAVCISPCGTGKTCPAGTDCHDYGQAGAYCQPSGGQTQGQPCSNAEKPCASGLACIGGFGGSALCAKSCKADGDCANLGVPNLYCATGKWGGWCVPNGTLQAFDSCYQKQWQCAKGLACIGEALTNPLAYCAKSCSGFADICGAGAKCEYFGNGQSWCVKIGPVKVGTQCNELGVGCEASALCIKGSPAPTCLQQCGYGFGPCPADSPCTYFPGSAIALCVPKGFVVGGPPTVPF